MKKIIIATVIFALTSCASTHSSHYKVWDSYKVCSAYGNP
jgi:hypothetical protein